MKDHNLPDDVNHWPRDPFALLGVDHSTSRRGVRQAYAHLIRKYKPELYPAHFRRIRAAYEQLSSHHLDTSNSADEASFETSRRQQANATSARAGAANLADEEAHAPSIQLEALWTQACDGDLNAAYRRLCECQIRNVGHPRAYAMLYWLLRMAPELDGDREPCDWLAQGIRNCGYREPLCSLYAREWMAKPQEALSSRFTALLSLDHDAQAASDLFDMRWQVLAGRPDNLSEMLVDLHELRARFSRAPNQWMLVVRTALRHLAWLRHTLGGESAFQRYASELSNVAVEQQDDDNSWDRLDWNISVAKECQRFLGAGGPFEQLRNVVQAYCRLTMPHARQLLMGWLRDFVANPRAALTMCDTLRNSSPHSLAKLMEMLQLFSPYVPVPLDDANELEQAVFGLFNHLRPAAYEKLRPRLLEFCVAEAISPETLAEIMLRKEQALGIQVRELARDITDDTPMNVVCLGHRTFWAS